VTHELFEFGECYSMLIIPSYDEDLPVVEKSETEGNTYYAFAYVLNKTCPEYSEFGTIVVRSFGGGICRVA